MLKLLLKLKYWKDGNVEYGFFVRNSFFSWGETLDPHGQGKELRFALGNKDWHVKYL